MYSFLKFIIIVVLAAFFSQAAMAQRFEVLSSNTLKYPPGFMLTQKHKVRLGAGEHFVLKAQNRAKKFRINGPYVDGPYAVTSEGGKKCKKDSLIGVLICLMISPDKCGNCDPNDIQCIVICNRFIPHEESEPSLDSFMTELWNIIKPRLFNEILPPGSEKPSKTNKIVVPNDPWLLVAPSDQDFCYRPDKPLTIWRPELFTGQLILLTGPADEQASTKSATGMDDLLVITLHAMPDENTLPSNTYKAVWMAEKGCYRQAELLLSLH